MVEPATKNTAQTESEAKCYDREVPSDVEWRRIWVFAQGSGNLSSRLQVSSLMRSWFRNRLFLLALTAFLLAIVVQSGELGSSDTMHRLQTAHSFWTSEPPVFPNEYPEFGVHGRGGKLYDWYGIGQPLLLLPFDVVGSYVQNLPIFSHYGEDGPSVRNIVVTYSLNALLSVLTALVCFRFLRLLQFTTNQALAGGLALLFCTTHLHYTQNMMENNYILLLTLTGFTFQYEWLRTGNRRALWAGSAAFGLNLLTRLTTGMDLLAGGIFVLLVLRREAEGGQQPRHRWVSYLRTALPVYAFFMLLDRAYQYYRFGTIFSTYVRAIAQEHHRLYPSLPASYPFETPFHVGLLGPLITPEKSIFLFEPLLLLTLVLALRGWKRFRPEIKVYLTTVFLLLLGYLCFYARYTVWSGDFAWGDRYVSTTTELAAFLSVPLLLRYRREWGKAIGALGVTLIALSAAVQLVSLAFWLPLEIYQMETLGHPTFVILLRFKNVFQMAFGMADQWGLSYKAMTEDPWDYVHITTWNFLPFVLRRVGEAPRWVVDLSFAIWLACLLSLGGVLAWIYRLSTRCDRPSVPP